MKIAVIILALTHLAWGYEFETQQFEQQCLSAQNTNAQIVLSQENSPQGLYVICEFEAAPQELMLTDTVFDGLTRKCIQLQGEFEVLSTRSMDGNYDLPAYLQVGCYFPYW